MGQAAMPTRACCTGSVTTAASSDSRPQTANWPLATRKGAPMRSAQRPTISTCRAQGTAEASTHRSPTPMLSSWAPDSRNAPTRQPMAAGHTDQCATWPSSTQASTGTSGTYTAVRKPALVTLVNWMPICCSAAPKVIRQPRPAICQPSRAFSGRPSRPSRRHSSTASGSTTAEPIRKRRPVKSIGPMSAIAWLWATKAEPQISAMTLSSRLARSRDISRLAAGRPARPHRSLPRGGPRG
mmetsp:Transcript_41625/g.97866  ORF Transcript_41625/g.97866 Transcript_41625/m.97866 type:complete len:240 (-) Transcript_41625:384-1103(-)